MKQKFLFAITLLFLSSGLFAQKNVDIDNMNIQYLQRQVPKKPLNPVFFHYATKISMPGTVKNVVDEESLYQALRISGQKLTETPAENDIIVNVVMGSVTILSSEVKEYVEESKDKEGKITRKYSYWAEVAYTFDAKASVSQGGANIGGYTMYDNSSKNIYKSSAYSTRKEAADFWNNNRDVMKEKFIGDCAVNAIKKLSSTLDTNFGFPIYQKSEIIKVTDEKKHPENEPFKEKVAELKSKVEALTGTTPLAESEVEEVIEYFKSIPGRYTDLKLKADIKLRYAAYFNLCRIYLFIDQPEKVKEWADLLLANDYDKKDAEKLIKEADERIANFNRTVIKSTQFETDSYFEN